MTFVLSVILSIIISVFTASESIKAGIKEQGYQDYGEHTLTLLDINTKQDFTLNNIKTEKVGEYQIVGTVKMEKGHIATVGKMDEQAIKMGRIELVDGTFPTKENEVSIEFSYLQSIDSNWEIGEQRELKINNENISLTLTGIVKDYSARWSVPYDFKKGVNDFPNIFLSEKSEITAAHKNLLVKLKENDGNIERITEKANEVLDEHKGFFNERLFFNSLANLKHISKVTLMFQVITLVASFLCMICLLHYFNIGQTKKFGILKSVGSTNKDLLKVSLAQVTIIFLSSIILAIPLQIILHSTIIKKTFHVSGFDISEFLPIMGVVALWLIAIFLITVYSSFRAIKNIRKQSIYSLIKEQVQERKTSVKIPTQIKDFTLRKVWTQVLSYPKQSILIVSMLTLAILIITFSVFIEKESAGIWDSKVDYYLNSQEIYGFDTRENLDVLLKEGLTFPPDDVREIEKDKNIEFVEKNPFMVDVHPLLREEQINYDIRQWIIQNGSLSSTYNDKYIIPNVRYITLNEDEFELLYPAYNFQDISDKVIIHYPVSSNIMGEKSLQGETITFAQTKKRTTSHGYDTRFWNFEVLEVSNEPFQFQVDSSTIIEYPEFTIVFSEDSAIEQGLFKGYNELAFFLKPDLKGEERKEIESRIYSLIALTPGSLYQNISTFIDEDTRMSVFVGYLGKLTFIVSILLSIISMTVIVFSKYKTQKREWGVYLSMGMRKRTVYELMFFEHFSYLITSTIIALILFSLTKFMNTLYSFFFYIQYFCLSVLVLFLLTLIGWFIIIRIIKNQSIFSLIREEE